MEHGHASLIVHPIGYVHTFLFRFLYVLAYFPDSVLLSPFYLIQLPNDLLILSTFDGTILIEWAGFPKSKRSPNLVQPSLSIIS